MTERRICLNQSVLSFMEARISPRSYVLEFGAGWSSRWFAERCGKLVSIESSAQWLQLARDSMVGVDCDWDIRLAIDQRRIPKAPDLVLVDSEAQLRHEHARLGWSLLKSGGWLVLDDAQRVRHRQTVEWLAGKPVRLEWSQGDIETARERLALAWQK